MTPRAALLAAVLALPAFASAHDFWIDPDRFTVATGESATLTMLAGHGDQRQRAAIPSRRILRYAAFTPSGEQLDLRGSGALAVSEIGLHLLVLESDAQALSHLPADRFNAYAQEEGLTLPLAARAQNGITRHDAIERYRRVAKALVQAGDPAEGSQLLATRRIGLPLEIVLVQAPSEPTATLAAHIYFASRPLPGALVKLTNLADDAQPLDTRTTDASGRVAFTRPPPGRWLLNVVWSVPAPVDSGADFDTTFSSLSFAIPNS